MSTSPPPETFFYTLHFKIPRNNPVWEEVEAQNTGYQGELSVGDET